MNMVMIRTLFAGAFGLIALLGALGLNFMGQEVEGWLVAIIAGATGFLFGNVLTNGNGHKRPPG